MLTKSELLEMGPDARAFYLIGAFMGYFALLEAGIGDALGEVLGVSGARRVIINRNMGFDEKIKTLRTLVDHFISDRSLAAKFDELAKQARKCGELRNIVAHTPFRASSVSDGVEFFRVSANSKLEWPATDWSTGTLLSHIDNINKIDNELRLIEGRMQLQRIAEALMREPDGKGSAPTGGGLLGLGGLFGLGSISPEGEDHPSAG
ncbi:hypothetical protein EN904_16355 [Mesorhizobium sp. M7A.F.Ca.CA.001.07.2.1]|uniref:hypothetical protein n=1 Tax=Mesorhizobium TaxID=68287 RepID=UPI000FC9AD0F|nr:MULTISPECIES: hypothetical protein [Mesorhizobium]RVB41209.1 hypothetical protein EN918_10505 [Mesorhizobium sp. M7A.F.Ca.CA.004.05.1.1]MCF6127328.1 hypothetical protein [Mesorhizobium ciceri]MCQ8817451.1 hypothetical protein [Mesorhizobium sp. SEMIA396]RUX76843.1 hypothetical protein EN983_16730 [Mesorhizobium sp. M7A.F.Ca.CA.004.08.2.1]RUX84048.1 hypothetical protein EN982_24665 [Mesorhizobium sp. M7A.F.Ca.CA.004.08.1.1]